MIFVTGKPFYKPMMIWIRIRVQDHGNVTARGKSKRADYVLFYKNNLPLAIKEKDNKHSVGVGLQQAIDYAKHLA